MDKITGVIQSHRTILLIFLAVLLIVAAVVIIKNLLRRSEKNKELNRAAEDRLRDENLNNVILNSYAGNDLKEVYTPYDVDYSNPNGERVRTHHNEQGRDVENHIMVQLVERTELSTRKFMLNPAKGIKIGSDVQENDITVMAEGISPHQCEIFSVRDKVYVRDLGEGNRTIVRRKKEQAIADGNGVRLLSNDTIILGNASYDVTIKNK